MDLQTTSDLHPDPDLRPSLRYASDRHTSQGLRTSHVNPVLPVFFQFVPVTTPGPTRLCFFSRGVETSPGFFLWNTYRSVSSFTTLTTIHRFPARTRSTTPVWPVWTTVGSRTRHPSSSTNSSDPVPYTYHLHLQLPLFDQDPWVSSTIRNKTSSTLTFPLSEVSLTVPFLVDGHSWLPDTRLTVLVCPDWDRRLIPRTHPPERSWHYMCVPTFITQVLPSTTLPPQVQCRFFYPHTLFLHPSSISISISKRSVVGNHHQFTSQNTVQRTSLTAHTFLVQGLSWSWVPTSFLLITPIQVWSHNRTFVLLLPKGSSFCDHYRK